MPIAPRRRLLTLLLVAISPLAARAEQAPPSVNVDSSRFRGVTELIRDHIEDEKIAGATALLIHEGDVVYRGALGHRDAETGEPMTTDTIFRIASMTKPITTVAAMMLVEEGKIHPDDPVAEYIPAFKDAEVLVDNPDAEGGYRTVPAERPVTIHHLMTHTSGITYGFFGREHLGELYADAGISDGLVQTEGTIGRMARRLGELPLKHQPGSAWEYGLSVDVLGRVVEVASGMPLDAFFRQRIFEPLGMEDTQFYLPEGKVDRLAALYRPVDGGGIERIGEEPVTAGNLRYSASYQYKSPQTYFSGGAGLVSTQADYARFLRMLLNGGTLNGTRMLEESTVEKMTSNQIGGLSTWITAHGTNFGYGFAIFNESAAADGPESPGTFAWGGIFYTDFWVDPEEEIIGIIMTQLYPNGHLSLRSKFHEAAYEAIERSGAANP